MKTKDRVFHDWRSFQYTYSLLDTEQHGKYSMPVSKIYCQFFEAEVDIIKTVSYNSYTIRGLRTGYKWVEYEKPIPFVFFELRHFVDKNPIKIIYTV